ncbi:MAG TPA: D-alanine--D-alanine ligase, partial [Phycisphaerae bacterium]|nr:D-alanine--D-alanine ligase [Phycisphaerae bacterium]
MIVGLTYDLRADYLAEGYGEEETAEFDRPDTIDAIESALRRLGHETQRIGNVRRLVEALAVGRRWDLVFNIAEGLRGVGRESQV